MVDGPGLLTAAVLAAGALASLIQEGPLNHQSLVWNIGALLLAAPLLLASRRGRLVLPSFRAFN